MQAFQASAARRLDRVTSGDTGTRRRGTVVDCNHEGLVTPPTQAHHALNDVLDNWRQHSEGTMSLASVPGSGYGTAPGGQFVTRT